MTKLYTAVGRFEKRSEGAGKTFRSFWSTGRSIMLNLVSLHLTAPSSQGMRRAICPIPTHWGHLFRHPAGRPGGAAAHCLNPWKDIGLDERTHGVLPW